MLITGQCHCGNIAVELDWAGDPPAIPARACGCTFCVKHGGVWTSNAKSRLVADFDGEAVEARLVRRSRNWIVDVRITAAAG